MNLTKAQIEKKTAQYAKSLLTQVVKNEPLITEDLQKIASEVAAEMVGLEHKFKTEESLTEKLVYKSQADLADLIANGISENDAIEESLRVQVAEMNDVLRYTFMFPTVKYIFGFRQTLILLANFKYEVPKERIWNAWKNIGTHFDRGYRGINITIISSHSQIFELQFHTEESFLLKKQMHYLYKKTRSSTVSWAEKKQFFQKLVEMAKEVEKPKGVKKL